MGPSTDREGSPWIGSVEGRRMMTGSEIVTDTMFRSTELVNQLAGVKDEEVVFLVIEMQMSLNRELLTQ